jgi:hypothetical protein
VDIDGSTANGTACTTDLIAPEPYYNTFGDPLFPASASISPEIQLQELETSQFTFPDDSILEVPILRVMRASFDAAALLGCQDALWDLTTFRTFDTSKLSPSPSASPTSSTPTITYIPPALRSTEIQKRVQHPAAFDLFPWPTLRDRLICVFAQPTHMRPPAARDPNALMCLVLDVDDPVDGFRVHGADAFDLSAWEVGEKFFRNWWWALDSSIIKQSDGFRRKRGLKRLSLTD